MRAQLFWIPAAVLLGFVGVARAQQTTAPPLPLQPGATSSNTTNRPAPAAQGTTGAAATENPTAQPINLTVEVGRGILIRLPQAAATVMAAQPEIARVQPASPTSLFLMGVAPGRTTVIATTENGTPIAQYEVTVKGGAVPAVPNVVTGAPPAGGGGEAMVSAATARSVENSIGQIVQGAQGVRVRAVGHDLVVSGIVATPAAAQQVDAIARAYLGEKGTIIDNLTVLTSITVNVRVRFAEISRTITHQLGFNWQILGKGGNWKFGTLTGAAASGTISPLVPLGVSGLADAAPYQIGGGYSSSLWDLNGIIDALASDKLITVLAEPNLTAQSGETASFLAGGEFPVPVAGGSNGQLSISFKQYGVSLDLVPTVLSQDRLSLRVRPEVSQLSTQGEVSLPVSGGVVNVPALTVRRAETTIELGSGQSFAIAGLLQKDLTDQNSGLPFLSEVPVLGALFRSTDFQRGETELVIIVTPYLVKPVAGPGQLHSPTDSFVPATDLERILYGRQMARGSSATGSPRLDAGFVLK
jgi:pilus assembly protein CpaC